MDARTLYPAERRLWSAPEPEATIDFRVPDADEDPVAEGSSWDEERTLRAEVLAAVLTRSSPQRRMVAISGARVTGSLNLTALEIRYPVWLVGCWFEEVVVLELAKASRVSFSGSYLPGLIGRGLEVRGNLALDDAVVSGPLVLIGARVGGTLALTDATLDGRGSDALLADHLQVDQDLLCSGTFDATGPIRLQHARVDGNVVFNGANIENVAGPALDAAGISVGQSFQAQGDPRTDRWFRAVGAVVLRDGRIRGSANLSGASIIETITDDALAADRMELGAGLRCRNGFNTHGAVRLLAARVAGQVDFSNSALAGEPYALAADGAQIANDLFLRGTFEAHGGIRLPGVKVGGQISLLGARLTAPDGQTDDRALNLQAVEAASLVLESMAVRGGVDLSGARVTTVNDDGTWWPKTGPMRLVGFRYEALAPRMSVSDRLTWLSRSEPQYAPGNFDQLADAYRRAGDDHAARKVLIAKQRGRREGTESSLLGRAWSRFLDLSVGYGYHPGRAFVWLVVLLLLGTFLFAVPFADQVVATSDAARVRGFSPFLYTLDLLLPVASLEQREGWAATGVARWVAVVLTLAGWLLGLTLVAALTGVFKQD